MGKENQDQDVALDSSQGTDKTNRHKVSAQAKSWHSNFPQNKF